MASIDYYFSLMSPFTYLAGMRLEKIAARHGSDIVYRPTDFASVLAETGGVPVGQRHPFRQEYRLQELRRLSGRADLPLNLQPKHWPVDPTEASVAVIAVAIQGGDAGRLARRFLRAVWAEEKDLSDSATVARLLREHGNEADGLAVTLPAARAAYAENTEMALAQGVFGAPFYITDGERFWGQDRLDYLDWHLSGRTPGG